MTCVMAICNFPPFVNQTSFWTVRQSGCRHVNCSRVDFEKCGTCKACFYKNCSKNVNEHWPTFWHTFTDRFRNSVLGGDICSNIMSVHPEVTSYCPHSGGNYVNVSVDAYTTVFHVVVLPKNKVDLKREVTVLWALGHYLTYRQKYGKSKLRQTLQVRVASNTKQFLDRLF